MKKITRFVSLLMAVFMLSGLFATAASAADIHLDTGSATVYVDDSKVKGISAYVDGFGEIRVDDEDDIRDIFEDELDGVKRLPLSSLIVTDWAEYYGYSWSQDDNKLYIYTDTSDTLVYPSNPSDPTLSDPTMTAAKVYVNGMYLADVSGVTTYGGEFFISSYATLKSIFPTEAANLSSYAYMEPTSLRTWATKYNYTMAVSSNRVYLNNDGKTAIEMTLNGNLVDFPDQQPFVVAPGRTMIPVRTVSEDLGCTVLWEGKVNGATHDRVKITKGDTVMYLWIGVDQFWIGGKYYKMDVAPYVLNGRTMVPARFVAEAFGYTIKYDSSTTVPTVRVTG